jgi:CheY-like chemotaxis protein
VAEFDHCLCSETFGGPRHLYIEVVDSGTGMDKETMQRICDPFYSSKLHSRGLGLASVLGIVRAHHGALCIKSSPGEGTCVRACLPLVESQSEPMVVPPAAEVETSAQGLILVVDDEEFLRVLCGRMLRRLGYEVVMAASGQEALDVYSERSGEIVCVILDLIMPGMDGVEVHEKLTAMDPEALVVMTSGYHLAEIAARFEGRGMAGFIQKPYRFTNLAEIVGSVIQSHKASG